MTDQWVPGPGCTPVPPDGIPPANTWTPADSCAPPSGPSITGGVIITGVPATIGSMVNGQYAWTITLNDGQSPPNFSIDRYSGGALVDHPIFISGVDGSVTFTGPVTLGEDPTEPLQAATKEYVDLHSAGVTEAPVDGQLYGRQSEGWTVVPPPPVLEAPADGQAYVRQSQAWAPLSASMAGYLPIAGGRMTGGIQMDGSLSNRWIVGSTAGSLRWAVNYGDATAESGSNAGSNFTIQSFTDAGAPLATPLTINRQYGNITIPGLSGVAPLAINGPSGSWRSIQSQTNGVTRWNMYLADPSGELGSNAGSNFVLNRYSDAGTIIPGAAALNINRATGTATFSALPSFPGGANGQALITNGSGVLSWGAAGIADAPTDGQQYARQNAGWTPFVSGPPTTISDTAPPSPQVGQLWWDSVGGQLYVWYSDANTSQWVVAVNAASRPPPASTTTLGSVKVDGTSIQAAPDGTISTVLVPMGDNRLINGDMRINQRGSTSINTYIVDRWIAVGSTTGKFSSFGQNTTTPSNIGAAGGFGYSFQAVSGTAYTTPAAEYYGLCQHIEADMIADFAWGTAGAQPVTLSFWAYCTVGGTYSGALRSYGGTRAYPFTYSLPANAWTKIVVTIPGDTAGTWVLQGNAGALSVAFDYGSGSTYRAPAGAWAAGSFFGANGAASFLANTNATFNITGVKLEIGTVATPFNRQSLAKSLADCQRYYEKSWGPNVAVGTAALIDMTQNFLNGLPSAIFSTAIGGAFRTTKRAQATLTVYNPNSGASGTVRDYNNNVDLTAASTRAGLTTFQINVTTTVAAISLNVAAHWTASAEL